MRRMPTSVMPKGVEHIPRWTSNNFVFRLMPTSVMPKGVEHDQIANLPLAWMPMQKKKPNRIAGSLPIFSL